MEPLPNLPRGRLLSLDAFRGAVMFLLVAEGTRLYSVLEDITTEGSVLHALVLQFHHHPWNGLRFWDLVQPFFMFIVGVAMVFSLTKRWDRGESRAETTRHILKRCALLLAFGTGLHCVYSGKLVWELWNVLSQLSVTILIAYFLFHRSMRTQILVSVGLLLLTEGLYRFWPVEGFDQPFVKDANFGTWMDGVLMGKINNGGGWVAINCIPTAAHTIWGVLAGKLLIGDKKPINKIKPLLVFGGLALVLGYGLDLAGITPIIKRICTSSFVLASGGWCLLLLALFYWLIDVKGRAGWVPFFAVVGANSIFIYLFAETVGKQWVNGFVGIFSNGFMGLLQVPQGIMMLLTSLIILLLEWGLCKWLYNRRLFFKI